MPHQTNEQPSGSDLADRLELSFSLSRSEIFWYNIYFSRWIVMLALVLAIAIIAGLIFWSISSGSDLAILLLWLVAGAGLGLAVCLSVLLAIYLQVYRLPTDAVERSLEPRNYVIDRHGIVVRSSHGETRRPWREIKEIVKTRRAFYLRTGDKTAIILPFRVFAEGKDFRFLRAVGR